VILAFLVGLACGFVGSIPIAGPAAILVVERGLGGHGRSAFGVGAGTGLAESGYALVAFLGMTAALSELPWLVPLSRILGALILTGLGLYLALATRSQPPQAGVPVPRRRAREGFVLGIVMTAVNPTLIITWTAVVTVLHSVQLLRVEPLDGFPFALGVGLGVTLWFGALLLLLRRLREKVSSQTLDRVVRVLGWVFAAAGVGLTVNLIVGGL
jgi:threonine/homoserine/homoserine lactone efflux protein